MLLKSVVAVVQIVSFSAAQLGLPDVPEGQYLLPVGGPNELVPEAHKQRNLQSTIRHLRAIVGPLSRNNSLTLLQGQVLTVANEVPEFASNIAGQIRPLGLFDDYQKSVEYWYIMPRTLIFRAATSLGLSFFGTLQDPLAPVWDGPKTEYPRVFSDGNMVSFQFIAHFALLRNSTFSEPWDNEATLELTGIMFHDRDGAICGYDVFVPSFSALWHDIDPLTQEGFPSPEAVAAVPESPYKSAYLPLPGVTTWLEEICDVATGDICFPVTGTKHYADKADCLNKLGQKRQGTHQDLDQDTLACRALHRLLVPSHPEGHCMHLSNDLAEEDGGVCIDRDSGPFNDRKFQCGYDDVGYTNSLASIGGAYVTSGYPFSLADFALTDPVTVAKEDVEGGTSCGYGDR